MLRRDEAWAVERPIALLDQLGDPTWGRVPLQVRRHLFSYDIQFPRVTNVRPPVALVAVSRLTGRARLYVGK